MRMIAHGSGSGLSLTDSVTWLYTVGDEGLAVSVELFDSREDVLKHIR